MPIFENDINPIDGALTRSRLTITASEIKRLYELIQTTENVGFESTVLITNDRLRVIMNNELVTIESDDYKCADFLDTPTGEDLAQDVKQFESNYDPVAEITRMQKTILDSNKVLKVEDVQQIESTVADTQEIVSNLMKALNPKKAQTLETIQAAMSNQELESNSNLLSETKVFENEDIVNELVKLNAISEKEN